MECFTYQDLSRNLTRGLLFLPYKRLLFLPYKSLLFSPYKSPVSLTFCHTYHIFNEPLPSDSNRKWNTQNENESCVCHVGFFLGQWHALVRANTASTVQLETRAAAKCGNFEVQLTARDMVSPCTRNYCNWKIPKRRPCVVVIKLTALNRYFIKIH